MHVTSIKMNRECISNFRNDMLIYADYCIGLSRAKSVIKVGEFHMPIVIHVNSCSLIQHECFNFVYNLVNFLSVVSSFQSETKKAQFLCI